MPETQQLETKQGYKKTKLGWIPEDWKIHKLEYLSEKIVSGSTPSRNRKDFYKEGIQPWIKTTDLNNNEISITDESLSQIALNENSIRVLPKGTVLVAMYGGFKQIGRTGVIKQPSAINQAISGIQPDKKRLDSRYLLHFLNYGVGFWRRYAASSRKDPNITKSDVKSYLINYPPLPEQKAIANCLSTWDDALVQLDQLIVAKQQLKKALMQQLLSGKKRLPGFTGEWEEKRLDYFFSERSERNNEDLPLLSIGEAGVYPQDNSNKKDTSNKDKSKYKKICVGDIGYNTMRMWQGRSALSNLEGIVSPAYTIVKPKKNTDSRFFAYLFKTPAIIHRFYRNSQGMVSDTLNCKFKDFAPIKLVLPTSREEQAAIAQVLNTADSEIELLKTQREQLQAQKKGLMQLLLTGKKRLKKGGI